jgi:hypothetical protein
VRRNHEFEIYVELRFNSPLELKVIVSNNDDMIMESILACRVCTLIVIGVFVGFRQCVRLVRHVTKTIWEVKFYFSTAGFLRLVR